MGNTNSMNNMTLMDQRSGFKYSSEYLRYSQIPYEPHHHNASPNHPNHPNQMPHHHFKFKERGEQLQMPSQIKVLPAVNFDSKLRITNNGAILHNGGTISNRKESDAGLHRSKSITETTTIIPPPYQMHRARTQMQINLQPHMKSNLSKNYASNVDLKIQDNRSLDRSKIREVKKGKAPMPPAAPSSKFKAPQTPTSAPPSQQPPPKPTTNESKKKIVSRMFGDTLRNSKDLASSKRNLPIISTKMSTLTRPTDKPKIVSKTEKPLDKMEIQTSKPSQLSKINPFSHLRRERTFDLTLMQNQNNVKVPKKFSPQLNKKEMPKMQKNYMPERRQSSQPSPQPAQPNFQDEILNATKRRSLAMTNSEKMKTIDKPFKKLAKESELKKTNSAITSSNSSLTNSSKSIPSKEVVTPKSKPIVEKVDEEIEEPLLKNEIPKKNNFYFGMNSKTEEEMEADEKEIACIEEEQMDAINRFAEDIFKTTNGGKYLAQVSSESALSSDYGEDTTDSSDICLNLRPTLPRKQLQIPRFNPSAAWRSLSIETNLNQMKGSSASTNTLLSNPDEQKNEAKIERIYREPSFNLPNQQQDNKSGDSGISAGDNGNTPENNLPSAYLLTSWTPQQDLPDEEESIPEDRLNSSNKESENEKAQTFYNSNGNIFSLSLPRESHCSSEKTPQNNFYSLQKMKKSVVDVFGGISISTIHDKIQITNYGVDGNWLLSKSQPSSIDDFVKKDTDKISITHVSNNNKLPSIMYLPSKVIEEEYLEQMDDNKQENLQDEQPVYKIEQEERFQPKIKSRNHRFTFQSTVRQVERRKIAEKLSREAEEKEVHRLGELEAMQKVEEEFQKKRAREKASIRHQLRIVSLEDYGEGNIIAGRNGNFGNIEDFSDDDNFSFKDTKTPYISKIIEKKSAKPTIKKKF